MTRDQITALASHYESRWFRNYAKSKLKTDPLYEAVYGELADSSEPLLDLGCGLGLAAFYFRTSGYTSPIHGTDYDRKKIGAAQAIAEKFYENITFEFGDARHGVPEFSGNVTILDILQFFTLEEQRRLLAKVAASISPKGKLIIRSGLNEPGWRFRVTVLGDLLAKATLWMRAAPVCYPTRELFEETLGAAGLKGTFTPLWGKTPFNNYLIVYDR